MNRNDKALVGIGVFLMASLLYFGIGFTQTTGEVIVEEENVTNGHHTKAVCDENNYCQDWRIVCDNGTLVEMHLVEGSDYQHDEDWVDLRSEEERELCY